ncbi:MAG: hypothetical protein SFV18_14110 [Bryobacteraceae bacterium]|nr:hypothetical protein [Bryobacteraceae bacterium]
MSPVLKELLELRDRHPNARDQEKLILKMAICLMDNIDDPWVERERLVSFTFEEYEKVPGRWELIHGQLSDY